MVTPEQPALTIGFIPIARPTFDVDLAREMTQQVRQQLIAAGHKLYAADDLIMTTDELENWHETAPHDQLDLVLLLQASFAASTMAQAIAEFSQAPLLLWALPEPRDGGRLRLNSFCGIHLAAHGLKRRGQVYETIYAAPHDAHALTKVQQVATAGRVQRQLRGTRIGRLGENPAGFDTCLVNYEGLRDHFGVEVVQSDLTTVFEAARTAQPEAIAQVREQVAARVSGLDSVDQAATDGTLGTYLTMRDMAERDDLRGMAVRCWPEFFTEMGCSACGAMSMLSDEHIPSSCEADVNGTLTQLILQWISGEAAFGADVVAFDAEKDEAVLWHCGLAPLSMADPDVQPEAALHSNRQKPLLMQFPLKPGRVTLARISEATGAFRLVIASGEMLKAPPSFTGTTGTLRFDSGAAHVMQMLLSEGLEHHISLTYGDHVATLETLARLLRLPILRL